MVFRNVITLTKGVQEAERALAAIQMIGNGTIKDRALAMTGASKTIMAYLTKLGVTSTAELSFAQKLKLTTMALWEQAKAWAATPMGMATIAAAGIFTAVKLFDGLTTSAEEAREAAEKQKEALATLKDEYKANEDKLSALNDELQTTSDRIDELNGKDTLTFTEAEELANLKRQNAELERQIALIETLQKQQMSEIHEKFIDVVGASFYGWNGEEGGSIFAGGQLKDALAQREAINKLMQSLQIDARAGDTMADMAQSRIEHRIENLEAMLAGIDGFLQSYSQEFIDASAGISYISNPTTTLEKQVNAYLDLINDFNDRMMIVTGADGAKENAINRLINGAYADVTKDLQELGEQGSVTAERLSDPKYAEFINKCIELGIISSNDAESLAFLALAFNQVVTGASGASSSIDQTKKSVSDFKTALEGVQKVLASQAPGKSLSLDDYNAEGMADYREALEYTNGAMQLNAEKVREITEAKAEEQKQIIATNKALAQEQYLKNVQQIEKYRYALATIDSTLSGADRKEAKAAIANSIQALLTENSALADTCKQYDLLSAAITEATSAYTHWLNSQNASDYGDMADDAVSAIKKIKDTYNIGSEDYGNFGSKKFAAAVEFIIPDTVDQEDLAAIEKYMQNFQQYLTFDDKGNVTGLNVDQFLSNAVEAGLMSYSEDDGYQILGNKKMEDFAKGLNMSSGMVTAMFDELQLKGAEFDFGDEAVQTFGDLAIKANEAANALREIPENKNLQINLDVSNLDTTEEQVDALDATIASMNKIKGRVNVSAEDVEYANSIIQYCVMQKQLLTQPTIMRVDTTKCEGNIADTIKLLQDFQTAQNNLEIQQALGMDTTEAQAEVDSLYEKIQGLSPEVKTALNISTTSIEELETSLAGVTVEVLCEYGVNAEAINGYNPETKDCEVVYTPNTDLLPKSFDSIDVSVHYKPDTDDLPEYFKTITRYVNYVAVGANQANGTAHARGTAAAGGDWGTASGGHTLVGELGREIVVDPRSGRWYTVGDRGAEFVNIPAGAIVFNHLQTESLLANGYVAGRAAALVSGTAMVTGGYNPYRPTGQSGGGGNGGNGSNSGRSTSTNRDDGDGKSWFERQYNDHQHWLAMDEESTEEYLNWLNDAYQRAYEEGLIDIDEYYKYQEEVYQGLKDLFKDYLGDIDHEISLLEGGVGNSDEVIALAGQAMAEIERELAEARAAGLDENSEYIQYLEQQWAEYSQTVSNLREDAEAESRSTIDDLVEYRINMIKQEIQEQKDALNQQLDDLQDFYDKQREMLQDKYDEEKYLEEQSEKRKSVADIQSELAMLANDNSAWAQKRKLELQEELAAAQKELSDFEKDHALDETLDMLDRQQAEQEAQIQAEMDALDERLNDPHALFNQALSDIANNTEELYQQFIEYNREHGTGNDQDIIDMWEQAYIADQEYQDTHEGQHMDGIAIGNYTGYVAPENPKPPQPDSSSNSDSSSGDESGNSQAPQLTDEIKKKVAAAIWHGGYGWGNGSTRTNRLTEVFGAGNGIQALVSQGVGRSGVSLTSEYTYANMRKKFLGYASGTAKATPGWHELFEGNVDEYIFTSSDGSKYRMFSGLGDKVLNGNATEFLYDFANSGGVVLTQMLADLLKASNFGNIAKPVQAIKIHAGDVIVQGNATERTVSEIRRANRDNLDFVLKELNRLNK